MTQTTSAVINYVRLDGRTGALGADQVNFVVWLDDSRGRVHAKSGEIIHITDVPYFLASWRQAR
jgi:hypothetical protein